MPTGIATIQICHNRQPLSQRFARLKKSWAMVQRKGQQRNGITWLRAPRIYCDLEKREMCASASARALYNTATLSHYFSAELNPSALIKQPLRGHICCRN